MSGSYPGTDPDDPFAKAPRESPADRPADRPESGVDETAPIRPEETGYWKRLAQQGQQPQQPQQPQPSASPYGAIGPDSPPPPPPTTPYGQVPYGQAPYGQAPYGQAPGYGYGQPAYAGYSLQQHPSATTSMVLGLIGLIGGFLTCGLLFLMSPFAWRMGARVKREIAQSNGQLAGEGNAQAGVVTGIIGTILLVLALIGLVLLIVVVVLGVSDSSSGGSTTFSTTRA